MSRESKLPLRNRRNENLGTSVYRYVSYRPLAVMFFGMGEQAYSSTHNLKWGSTLMQIVPQILSLYRSEYTKRPFQVKVILSGEGARRSVHRKGYFWGRIWGASLSTGSIGRTCATAPRRGPLAKLLLADLL